jgi:hypothetical protein
MNPEIKAKWVAALRSGNYDQSTEYLQTANGYCCLGVLCEIYRNEKGGDWKQEEKCISFNESSQVPPNYVSEWAGIYLSEQRIIEVTIGEERESVAAHNDSGKTFAEIADAIEEQL